MGGHDTTVPGPFKIERWAPKPAAEEFEERLPCPGKIHFMKGAHRGKAAILIHQLIEPVNHLADRIGAAQQVIWNSDVLVGHAKALRYPPRDEIASDQFLPRLFLKPSSGQNACSAILGSPMAKTEVSATTLSETFVRRIGAMYPEFHSAGFEVENLGGGRWRPRLYRTPIPGSILPEALALVDQMQSQFDLSETLAAATAGDG